MSTISHSSIEPGRIAATYLSKQKIMKIALIGYGKMGHIIEKIALSRGNEITCRIDVDNEADFDSDLFRNSDVAIEFSAPKAAPGNVLRAFRAGVPVVSGTTGWSDRLPEFKTLCDEGKGTLLWASNFSIGVNIFMAVNRSLARIMENFPQYRPSLVETHHIHKLDHPSGTAITLAEEIVEESSRLSGWKEEAHSPVDTEPLDGALPEVGEGLLPMLAVRRGEVPGIHTITWDSPVDSITISHSAKSREGFALGAVMAAEWLASRKGWHTMAEMLSDLTHSDIFSK